jgi:thymidylate kinase
VIVAIDGPDGAGKSTQIRQVEKWAADEGIACRVISKWDVFDQSLCPDSRFLRGTRREELRVCIAEMSSTSRCLFIAWLIASAVARARQAVAELVVLDGFWIKHAAAELILGTDPSLVEAIGAALGPVDAVLYLDVRPEESLRRKGRDITPYECGLDVELDATRFLAHQRRLRDQLLAWAAEYRWQVIGTDSVDGTQARIRDLLRQLLAQPVSGCVPPPVSARPGVA